MLHIKDNTFLITDYFLITYSFIPSTNYRKLFPVTEQAMQTPAHIFMSTWDLMPG